jgi:transcriptional regulator with XRE-family HTH domain
MTIAEALTAAVAGQAVSVYSLAKRTGMSAGRIHAILDGKTPNPGIVTVGRLLAALGLPWKWLDGKVKL